MNNSIKKLLLAFLCCAFATHSMEKEIASHSESDRLGIVSTDDYSMKSPFFISDSDGSHAHTSDGGPLLNEPSSSGWDSDILDNIHDAAIVRNRLKDRMYHDMSVDMDAQEEYSGEGRSEEEETLGKLVNDGLRMVGIYSVLYLIFGASPAK